MEISIGIHGNDVGSHGKAGKSFPPKQIAELLLSLAWGEGGGEIQEMVLSTLIFVVVKCRKASFQNFKYFVEKPNVKCRGGFALKCCVHVTLYFYFF